MTDKSDIMLHEGSDSQQSELEHTTSHTVIKTDTYAIDEDALGKNLPKNYYSSPGFIGTVVVSGTGSSWKAQLIVSGTVSR